MKRAGLALGFTLIEMAIVLVVIGLLLSGGIVAITPVVQGTKVSETKSKLDRVEQALVLHVIRYGCLPCPATPGTASTVATAGQASAGGTPYATGCQAGACDNTLGVVPWVNLEISESDAADGFGKRFTYALSPGLQSTDGMTRTPPSGYPAGTLDVNNIAGTAITSAAAYVLISHGSDGAFGYGTQTGTRAAADTVGSVPQLENSDNDDDFIQDELFQNQASTNFFDDVVRWRSAPMIVQLCGANACGNPA